MIIIINAIIAINLVNLNKLIFSLTKYQVKTLSNFKEKKYHKEKTYQNKIIQDKVKIKIKNKIILKQ